MSVLEDLLLRFQAVGFREGREEIDATAGAVQKVDKHAKEATKSTGGLGKSFGGLKGMAANAAGMIGVGGLALGLGEVVKNAQHFQDVQSQLGASLHANVRRPAKDATNQMSEFADSMSERGGFAATDAMQGMTQFLRVTKNVQGAEKDMTLATNIARGAHVDLGRAVRAVTMLEQGRTTGLSKLGIVVPKVTTAYDNLKETNKHATLEQVAAAKATDALASKQQAMANVSHQYSGAMGTYSKTSAGGINNLRNSVEVLSVKLGTLLLPAVNWIVDAFVKMVKPLGDILGYIKPLLPLLGALAGAFALLKLQAGLAALASAATSTALWGNVTAAIALIPEIGSLSDAWVVLNGVMDANPIGAVILAIGLLVGAFILAYKHVKWFRDAANATWKWLKGATVDTFHAVVGAIDAAIKWIEQHWPLVRDILIGPIGLAVLEIVKHFDTIKKLPGEILSAFKSVGGAIANAIIWPFVTAFNWVKHHLPHFHTVHIGPVGVPMPSFQSGGPVTSTGPYLVGERGPEVVTLPQGGYVHPNSALGGLGGQPIIIYNILDGKLLSQSIIRQGLLQASRGG